MSSFKARNFLFQIGLYSIILLLKHVEVVYCEEGDATRALIEEIKPKIKQNVKFANTKEDKKQIKDEIKNMQSILDYCSKQWEIDKDKEGVCKQILQIFNKKYEHNLKNARASNPSSEASDKKEGDTKKTSGGIFQNTLQEVIWSFAISLLVIYVTVYWHRKKKLDKQQLENNADAIESHCREVQELKKELEYEICSIETTTKWVELKNQEIKDNLTREQSNRKCVQNKKCNQEKQFNTMISEARKQMWDYYQAFENIQERSNGERSFKTSDNIGNLEEACCSATIKCQKLLKDDEAHEKKILDLANAFDQFLDDETCNVRETKEQGEELIDMRKRIKAIKKTYRC